MLIIAHRGASFLHPENTLTAFRAAQSLGADTVECDVHLSRDGQLVVIHDDTVDRTTNGSGPVVSFDAGELSRLDAGGGDGIPTFEQLLKAITLPVVVELKTAATEAPLVEMLHNHADLIPRLTAISFDHDLLARLSARLPQLACGALLETIVGDPVVIARSCGARLLSLYHGSVDSDLVQRVHEAGLDVTVWTVNQPKDIERMLEMGVDAVATDRPEMAIHLINGRTKPA